MRALPLLAWLLLWPAGVVALPDEPARDLVVEWRPGERPELPRDAACLAVLDACVLTDASAATEARLRADPRVLRVTRAVPLERHAVQEGGAAPDPNLRLTRADAAGGPTGEGVTVAVVDSGIDATHPDLAGRVRANVRLVEGAFAPAAGDLDGHGTHVAGIVAADGRSSQGRHRGVAPGAELVGVDISGRFNTASALLAYDWLFLHRHEHGVRVVVNAWGRVDDRRFDPDDPVIRAIDRLVATGVVVLFSASNHGPDAGTLSMEAQDPWVVTVGAVDAAAQPMPYSSRGPVAPKDGAPAWVKPDVVAPGERVTGLRSQQAAPATGDPDPLHRTLSGTSQSVPHVAGVVALMLEANPRLTPTQVANALRESAIDLAEPGPDDATGFGLVDARDAVRRARGEAPDRGNVLVAGGTDRHRDAATVGPTPRGLLGLGARSQDVWSTEFPVKPGATALRFDLAMPDATLGSPIVTLERDGATLGPWTRAERDADGAHLRGEVEAPTPGVWTLRVHASAPAALDLRATVDVTLPPHPERALELDTRHRLPDELPQERARVPEGVDTLLARARLALRANPSLPAALAAGLLLALALRPPPPGPRRVKKTIVLQEMDPEG